MDLLLLENYLCIYYYFVLVHVLFLVLFHLVCHYLFYFYIFLGYSLWQFPQVYCRELSLMFPLAAFNTLSRVSLVFEVSKYSFPCTIWRLKSWISSTMPIRYVHTVIILYLTLKLIALLSFLDSFKLFPPFFGGWRLEVGG